MSREVWLGGQDGTIVPDPLFKLMRDAIPSLSFSPVERINDEVGVWHDGEEIIIAGPVPETTVVG